MAATVFEKPTETARMIKGGAKEASLFVSEHADGTFWATNRYWIIPVERVVGLLSVYNLPADNAGHYEVNGRVTRVGEDAPKVASILDAAKESSVELTRETLPGSDKPIYVEEKPGKFLALYVTADGERVALNSSWVDWISSRYPQRHGVRYGELSIRTERPGKPVAFFVTRETSSGGLYVGDGASRRFEPTTWHADGEEFLGALMPVRLSS